jgi:hypothetical protein
MPSWARRAVPFVCLIVPVVLAAAISSARSGAVDSRSSGPVSAPVTGRVLPAARLVSARPAPTVGAVAGAPVLDLAGTFAGATIERSQCVTVALRPGVAYECGALRVAYALPTIITQGEARTATLVYRSDHAAPRPTVRVRVTLPAGATDSVSATLRVDGVDRATRRWPASDFPVGQPREIGLQFDATALPTGLYAMTVFVSADGQTASAHGELPIVNRRASPFGPGWWLAGYETLVPIAGSPDWFWVGETVVRGASATGARAAARGASSRRTPSMPWTRSW